MFTNANTGNTTTTDAFTIVPDAADMLDAIAGNWFKPDTAQFGKWNKIRVTFHRTLTMDECWKASCCIGYALKQFLHGEHLSFPLVQIQHENGSWLRTRIFYLYDSSLCSGDDVAKAFESAAKYIIEGSPAVTTDQRRPKGTRCAEGIGPVGVAFHVQEQW